jgi:hypothetical protein
MSKHLKEQIISFLKLALAASIIYWMIATGTLNLHDIAQLTQKKLLIFKVMVMIFAGYTLLTIRWYMLLTCQGVTASFSAVTRITCIGLFFNSFMLGSVGGDLIKAFYIAKENAGYRTRAIMSILIDRIIGLEALLILAFMTLLFNYKFIITNPPLRALLPAIGICIISSFVVAAAVFSRRIKKLFIAIGLNTILAFLPKKDILINSYNALHSYSSKKKKLVQALLISFLTNIIMLYVFYIIGREIGETVIPFLGYCSIVPVGVITLSIPIAPAGIGIGQAAFYNLFKWYGAHSGTFGAAIITAYQLIQLMVNLSFVFVYLSNKRSIGRAVNLSAR